MKVRLIVMGQDRGEIGLPFCFDCGRVLDVPPTERREPPDPPWVVAQLAKVEAGLCEQGKGYWL
jgi:hypothetical protein